MNDEELSSKIREYMNGTERDFIESFIDAVSVMFDYIDSIAHNEKNQLLRKYEKLGLEFEVLEHILDLQAQKSLKKCVDFVYERNKDSELMKLKESDYE